MCECGCGQVLMECNHVGCTTSEQMRKELKLAMDRGDSDDVILAGFVAKYGPAVLSAPTTTGFNRVAWIMPVVIFIRRVDGGGPGGASVEASDAENRHRTRAVQGAGELDEFRRRAREETSHCDRTSANASPAAGRHRQQFSALCRR